MIHSLELKNFIVHKDAKFVFTPGLNTIVGPNASGKSTILEAMRFALHGTAALRGRADDVKGARVVLRFSVKNVEYQVSRTTKDATLLDLTHGTTLAVGTRPVNGRVAELFGYGLTVFDTANCANQGDIAALSSMRPAERKRLVDTTLGLSVIDNLIKWCNDEGSLAEREASSITATLPTVPELPPRPEGDPALLKAEIEMGQGIEHDITLLKGVLSVEVTDPGPCPHPDPDVLMQEVSGLLRADAERKQVERELHRLISAEQSVHKECLALAGKWGSAKWWDRLALFPNELDRFREYLAFKKTIDLHPAPTISLQEIEEQEARHHNAELWADWDRHMRECPKCAHQWSTAGDVPPERLPLPTMTKLDIRAARNAWARFEPHMLDVSRAAQTLLELRQSAPWWSVVQDLTEEGLQVYLKWREKAGERDALRNQSFLQEDKYFRLNRDVAVLPSLLQLKQAYDKWVPAHDFFVKQSAAKKAAQQRLDILLPIRKDVAALSAQLAAINEWTKLSEWHARAAEERARGEAKVAELTSRAKAMWAVRDALGTVKTRVKAHIAPSLSRVASGLVARLSGGLRGSVQVDEEFDLWVDQQPVDTLSGSEKDAANLALRIALGQVLTARVFPVFLADEPDAAMDATRAEAVASVLPTVARQVILVTHKEPQAEANTIRLAA